MADLVDKFFSMDMSESEEEALDELLASSPEAASRFSEKASEIYARYGLPDLGPDSTPGKNFWWRLRLGLLAFVLVLAGGYGWWCRQWGGKSPLLNNFSYLGTNETALPGSGNKGLPASMISIPSDATPSGESIHTQGPKVLAKNQSDLESVEEKNSLPSTSGPGGSAADSLAITSRVPSFPPASTPATGLNNSLAANPPGAGSLQVASAPLQSQTASPHEMAPPQSPVPTEKGYSRLKIDLVISQNGPVTVRILDSSGVEVKNLYSGPLTAGTYAFTWDGKLDNGNSAPPGKYQIESLGGQGTQTREFWIEKKKKTVE
jgi:hypothetical protein